MTAPTIAPSRFKRSALWLLLAAFAVGAAAWWHGAGMPVAVGDATPATVKANAAVAATIATRAPNTDAQRGLIAKASGVVLSKDGSVVWDFERFNFLDGAAPSTVNPSLWRHAKLNNQPGLFRVSEGIYQLRGFDLANLTIIEGRSGWIVVDPLTTQETATAALAFARKHLGDKPVTAIIFTHSHVDHFGGALGIVDGPGKVPVIAPAGFLDEATSENILVGAAMGRRATFQFGNQLPASSSGVVDAGLGKGVALGQVGILAPTIIVSEANQELTIDGLRFVFQNVPGSEAPSELAFYLPERNAYCGAEMMTQSLHNLYTLRGAKVRDAQRWAGYIDQALQRFGTAEVFFASHHWPVWGAAQIRDFMTMHRDALLYIHDQSVRMLNSGLPPQDIAEQLVLPPSLQAAFAVHGYYGTLRHNAKAVYQHYLGWFDGNPANLDPLPRQQAAQRYVALMGGIDKTVAAGRAAFEQGEYRWAAELLNHAVFAQSKHSGARELLARTYDQLGFQAESAIWRNFYLSAALELRSAKTGMVPPASKATAMLEHAPVERYLDAMAASLNGPKADGVNLKINLLISDSGASHVLWIENAVLHHRPGEPDPSANATLTLTRSLFTRLLVGTAGIKETLLGDQLKVSGSKVDLLRFFSLIDKAPTTFPIVTP